MEHPYVAWCTGYTKCAIINPCKSSTKKHTIYKTKYTCPLYVAMRPNMLHSTFGDKLANLKQYERKSSWSTVGAAVGWLSFSPSTAV